MADFDEVELCKACLRPVEALPACPCGGGLARCPSLLVSVLRRLKAKGWTVERWSWGLNEKDFEVRLEFRGIAPVVMGNMDRWRVRPELKGYGNPSVSAGEKTLLQSVEILSEWADKSARLALPFSAALCDKCRAQGAEWSFSSCRCPAAGGWVCFDDGLPERCAYADAQVVTRPSRLARAMEEYEGFPCAARALRRYV